MHETIIDLNNNNFNFYGSGSSNNRVGIGASSEQSRLTVGTTEHEYAGIFNNYNPLGTGAITAEINGDGLPTKVYFGFGRNNDLRFLTL